MYISRIILLHYANKATRNLFTELSVFAYVTFSVILLKQLTQCDANQ